MLVKLNSYQKKELNNTSNTFLTKKDALISVTIPCRIITLLILITLKFQFLKIMIKIEIVGSKNEKNARNFNTAISIRSAICTVLLLINNYVSVINSISSSFYLSFKRLLVSFILAYCTSLCSFFDPEKELRSVRNVDRFS